MMDNFIQLNKDNILRLGIKNAEGKDTGEHLEFDLEDVELPLRYQEMVEKEKRNRQNLRNELAIIEKREDVKGKKMLSKNQEDEIKAINDFYKKEIDVLNMFLGDRGCEKLLNGRKIGITSLDEIIGIIENQIAPYIDKNIDLIKQDIKKRYKSKGGFENKDIEVIEDVGNKEN